jgi:hypothetical protein
MCVWREPGTFAGGRDVGELLSPARFVVLDVIGLGARGLGPRLVCCQPRCSGHRFGGRPRRRCRVGAIPAVGAAGVCFELPAQLVVIVGGFPASLMV